MRVYLFKSLKGLSWIGGVLAIAYLSVALLLWWRQSRFIFYPSETITQTPADLQMSYQDIWLEIKDEERIHGWWIPASSQTDSPGVILYLHGNGINVGANVNHANRFHRMGFSVFLFDYRGYGRSEGAFPTENSVYQDAKRAWQYLVEERQIPPEQIYLYGHSLGGAVAIELATSHPNAAGIIVESSFTSMRQMVDYQYPVFNLLPINLLLTQRFDSLSKVRSLSMPILLIHGLSDRAVPPYMSESLYEAAPEPKQLFLVPDADHTNTAALSGESYFQAIQDFIKLVESQNQLSPK